MLVEIMKKHGHVEKMADTRWYVDLGNNDKNENILVEVSTCKNDGSKYALPKLWKKNGCIDHELKTWISLTVYVTYPDGSCHGKYNPQIKDLCKINFDWMFEVSDQSLDKLLTEVERQANL